MPTPSSLPTPGPTREEIAKIEVGHTAVDPRTARLLVAAFVVAVALVPLAEWLGAQALRTAGQATAWSHLQDLPRGMRARAAEARAAGASTWGRLVAANRVALGAFSAFEIALEDESRLGQALRPPAQLVMTGLLGAGNERVYPGRDGWLFYRPDVDYVTGRPFLDPKELARRIRNAAEWDQPPAPDPRDAIVRFARDLEARGITLVVMPTPVKPGVHPDKLDASYERGTAVLHNPSYGTLVDDLRQAGVIVFEPVARAGAPGSESTYLATDTHWRPETMEEVAARLAAFLRERVDLSPVDDPRYLVERVEVTNRGDIERMLDLPGAASLFPPETVFLRRVLREDGSLWRSSPDADVLVLGDSFSNIYSLETMEWGTSAGFVEQLSYALRRPVDRLIQNDQGAFATREMLRHQPPRLAGKRVVVWQFAERELSFGDWKALPLPDATIQ